MFEYIDIDRKLKGKDIGSFFPRWENEKENVCVFSPHDDDAIIGAGYAILAALENKANVYIVIFSNGDKGYSDIKLKDTIYKTRRDEAYKAYRQIGIKERNILRFDCSDYGLFNDIGYMEACASGACLWEKMIRFLREIKCTRLLVPNHYLEHIDHTSVSLSGVFAAPQIGDSVALEWGAPHEIKTVMEYSVWADFSPLDSIYKNRKTGLASNRLICADKASEMTIRLGITEFTSQTEIIKDLIDSRKNRMTKNNMFIEVYLEIDPRPKLDFKSYIQFMDELSGSPPNSRE